MIALYELRQHPLLPSIEQGDESVYLVLSFEILKRGQQEIVRGEVRGVS